MNEPPFESSDSVRSAAPLRYAQQVTFARRCFSNWVGSCRG